MPNNAVILQSSTVLIVLVNSVDQHNEYHLALQDHIIVWHLFGDKQTSKSHETKVSYVLWSSMEVLE